MGDRGNIAIVQDSEKTLTAGGAVWLYGHWSGSDLPAILQKSLAKKWRWIDAQYLARIIFDDLTAGHHGEETSFGIGTGPGDNEYPYLVVDGAAQIVKVMDYNRQNRNPTTELARYTFKEFLALEVADKSPRDLAKT